MAKADTSKPSIEELENMLSDLASELTEARFSLGELPSRSAALNRARDYLKSIGQDICYTRIRNPEPIYDNRPQLLRPQAI